MINHQRIAILLCAVVAISCTNSAVQSPVDIQEEEKPKLASPASSPAGTPAGAGSSAPSSNKQGETSPSTFPHRTSCNYFVGKALGGQAINLDVCSIQPGNLSNVPFVYYLGTDRVESSANCLDLNWTTYPENQVHTPQSEATEKMLVRVCQG